MNSAFVDYYRCPPTFVDLQLDGGLSEDSGYFLFGPGAVCYGRTASGWRSDHVNGSLWDARAAQAGRGALPFDLTEVIDNLRCERYFTDAQTTQNSSAKAALKKAYYLLRPLLGVAVRKHLQKIYLKDWESLRFPHWPVDFSVEHLLERALALLLGSGRAASMPFIWFWPEGRLGSVMMTHDVETAAGRDFCERLMDLNDSFGVKSAFQIVPEKRYSVPRAFLNNIQKRGFEVNVHGLDHDGNLFGDRKRFLQQAERINRHAREYGALGFRSPVLYRNVDWFEALDFSYDMSIPNVAHLDPQRGGCCTVMPYFINDMLELPLTTTQDYSLFNVLDDYSIALWQKQIGLILERYGLLSFIVHPDYIIAEKNRAVYAALLQHLTDLALQKNLWLALPQEINAWWRQRRQLKLVRQEGRWQIEGPGSARARVAHAMLVEGRIEYKIDESQS